METPLSHLRKVTGWSDQISQLIGLALRPESGFDPVSYVRTGVQAGRMEVFEVNKRSLAVTECDGATLRVHAYQGRDLLGFARMFHTLCRNNGVKRATFHTDRPALVKALGAYQPKRIAPNEYEVLIK